MEEEGGRGGEGRDTGRTSNAGLVGKEEKNNRRDIQIWLLSYMVYRC